MRPWMTVTLQPPGAAPAAPVGLRRLDAGDAEKLARLMLDAYAGTVDDAGNETIETAREEVGRLLRGEFGALDAPASVVVERDGLLASATLVTRERGEPFVAFSMTAPAWQRRGLARAGLVHVMRTLAMRGEQRLHLVVTAANTPAVSLYRSLGFVEGKPARSQR
ncbi:MAG: GNAT family N-acetyltransferase [Phycisphaerales bacterium]